MSDTREVQNVVTSENSADFYANRLGLATEETPTEAVVEETQAEPVVEEVSESEPEAEEKPATEERKQNPKLEKRFSELTKQREEARKEAQREREARESLEQRLRDLENANKPAPKADLDAKPQPHQFNDAFEYAEALAEYTAEKALQDRERAEEERKAAEARSKQIEAWNKRQADYMAELPDYQDMIESSDVKVSDPIRDAIIDSEVGPRILYHLAENPEFADKINGMSVISALREIGKLEAKFEKSKEAETEKPKAVAKKSNAPEPIKPLKASSAATDVQVDSDGQFHGTYAQWREARRAGKIR